MIHRLLQLAVSCSLALALCGCFYVPTAQDHTKASAVAAHISSKFGRFEKRGDVEKTHSGKTFYVRPGRYPEVLFYEIVDPADITAIEESAKEALSKVAVEKVSLVFYEKQNISCSTGGGCSRGKENVIKQLLVSK